ncbi:ParB-like nuclease domain protein [Pseudobythopirellula maris]|uniref:ParB-like nuclease domain protein n=1 Tax=Pseudobythopirellula maris TaxID=2527991 RepID=A0A5C5ZVH3_9BACT|nr:ParB N-terminal domain-containing protein [Pseudobythopirellula maris]TWT91007.1 ParB-like nuclease domain protein [Pseudobythopirellula maris]
MKFRDRVKGFRRVAAKELLPHPENWRTHSRHQKGALRGVLREIGFTGAVIARELEDGRLQLIDGHLRAETAGAAEVPVIVVDLNEEEARKALLSHDPLAAMAGVDDRRAAELLAAVETESNDLRQAFAKIAAQIEDPGLDPFEGKDEVDIPASYQVVIEVDGEQQQEAVYERMRSEGFNCRVLTL